MPDPTQKTTTTSYESTRTVRQKRRLLLRVQVPNQTERALELTKTRITIGRSRSNQVVLEHASVSSTHAELHQIDERIVLVDSGSRNGSWVNDRWVQRGEIVAGDEIRFGEVRVVLVSFDEVDVTISSEHRVGELWGSSAAMREVFAQLMALGASEISLLLTGETGTGKELAARAVHALSSRSDRPFSVVDCGNLVPTLAVSALFGHAKGAFTGADRAFPGAFEVTEGGTILLDEIGELSLELQTMLLRVLDRGEVTRLGEQQPRRVDVRVIAATHRSLSAMVAAGTFREDLYFRLVEGEIELLPLRRRKGDVTFLAQWFLAREGEGGAPSSAARPYFVCSNGTRGPATFVSSGTCSAAPWFSPARPSARSSSNKTSDCSPCDAKRAEVSKRSPGWAPTARSWMRSIGPCFPVCSQSTRALWPMPPKRSASTDAG